MKKTRFIVRSAVIAALYAAVTLATAPISYGPIQVRVSEAMTVLPLLCPEAIIGLTVGCMLGNIPMGIWDVVVGGAATLVSAVATRLTKKIYFGVIPPIVVNALLIPVVLMTMDGVESAYWLNVLTVAAGQTISVVLLGVPLYLGLKKAQSKYPRLLG